MTYVYASIALVLLALSGFGGYKYGYSQKITDESNQKNPLIAISCPPITPPINNTFGATTTAYVKLIGQYRECKKACE